MRINAQSYRSGRWALASFVAAYNFAFRVFNTRRDGAKSFNTLADGVAMMESAKRR